MPMRLRTLKGWLEQRDISVATGTRHFQARKDGYAMFPIPAHNGLKSEIPNKYLKALCRHFGIDPSELPI